MESNEDKLFANRMKKRGMSWTIQGAHRMGKAIELSFNGNLKDWCGRRTPESKKFRPSFELFQQKGSGGRASLPAMEGLHASRPWVKAIKDLTDHGNLLN
jgi:hypothetical protein